MDGSSMPGHVAISIHFWFIFLIHIVGNMNHWYWACVSCDGMVTCYLLSVRKHGRLTKLQTWTKNGLNMSNLTRHLQNIQTLMTHQRNICRLSVCWIIFDWCTMDRCQFWPYLQLLFSQFNTLSSARPAIDVCKTYGKAVPSWGCVASKTHEWIWWPGHLSI